MQVILLKDLEKVGEKHETVEVKPGFGRNYLIPQGLAVLANDRNVEKVEQIKQKEMEELMRRKAEFEEIAEKLKGTVLKIGAKAGTSNKIFGSVTNIQISQALKDQLDLEIDRKVIDIPEEVKTLGTYTAVLNLHPEVDTRVTFEVVEE